MASDAHFVEYVCDQLRGAGGITSKKMFGEYAIYRRGKVVALVCDNQLFVKPTDAGLSVLGSAVHGAPYPGAKPHFLVSDLLDDQELLVRLIEATDRALPAPKKKGRRGKAKAGTRAKSASASAAPKRASRKRAAAKRPRRKRPS